MANLLCRPGHTPPPRRRVVPENDASLPGTSCRAAGASQPAALCPRRAPLAASGLASLDLFIVNLLFPAISASFPHAPAQGMSDTTTYARPPDLAGTALLVIGMAALIAAISYVTEWGLTSPWLWSLTAIGVAALAWFVARCLTAANPAVNLRIFRVSSLRQATTGMAVFYVSFSIMLLGGSVFLQDVWRWSPVAAGLGFAAGPATAVFASLTAGKLRLPPRVLVTIGGILFLATAALWAAALTDAATYPAVFLPGMILTGTIAGSFTTAWIIMGIAALLATCTAALIRPPARLVQSARAHG